MVNKKYVCSLENARKLKKLDLPQDSIFYWVDTLEKATWELMSAESAKGFDSKLPAYTASELKDYFPSEIWVRFGAKQLRRRNALTYFAKVDNKYIVSLQVPASDSDEVFELMRIENTNEADSCAEMLLYLYQEGFIEPKI